MGADLTTVETVDAGEYRVRVAQTDDGAAWEAVVIDDDARRSGSSNSGTPSPIQYIQMGTAMKTPDADDDGDAPIGQPVTAPHRWVAIGFAIEAYEWGQINETPEDVADAYEASDVAFLDDDGSVLDVRSLDATEFSGSFTLGGADDE